MKETLRESLRSHSHNLSANLSLQVSPALPLIIEPLMECGTEKGARHFYLYHPPLQMCAHVLCIVEKLSNSRISGNISPHRGVPTCKIV